MKINFKITLVLITVSFILFVFFLSLGQKSQYDTRDLIGKKIDNFNLKTLEGEKNITEVDLMDNDYTLINFWASWCSPCRAEHKYLIKIKNNLGLKILGVNFKDKNKNAIDFLNELGNPYSYIVKDNSGKHSIKFGVYGIPESILINKDLIVVKKFIGPIKKEDLELISKILKNL
ncbi:MAG: DsbE family thiol:disulfide interchange protein [Pelagibacteraceae bacterium]